MIRLLICDDSESLRTVLRTMLAEHPEISVVGEAGDGQEAVDLALALSPDVILMDVRMPILDGVEATREITTALPSVRIVALTGSDDRAVVGAMLEAGASATASRARPLGAGARRRRGRGSRRPTGADARRRPAARSQAQAIQTGLPRRRRRSLPPPTAGTAEPRRPQPRLGPDHPTRVLVVDDDERLRILLRTTLEVIDIEIDEARPFRRRGLGSPKTGPTSSCSISDCPARTASRLCEELKRDPRTRDIGIVVLTGSDEGTGSAARAAGADAYLRKPFSRSTCSRSSSSLRADSTKGRSRFPTHDRRRSSSSATRRTSGGCSSSSRASGP